MPPKPRPPQKPRAPQPKTRSGGIDPRLWFVLGAGALVGVVAVVLSISLGGGKSKTPTAVTADLSSVAGIEQHGLVLGKPSAKVGLTEYLDTSCPICKNVALAVFPTISKDYIRPGKVKLDARVLAFVGPSSARGRELVLAAAQQNKAWQLIELLYQNQGDETQAWLTDDLARALAAKIPGLDVSKLLADASSAAVQTEIEKVNSEAQADGVRGTPTLVVTTKTGKREGVSPDTLATALDQALAG